MPLVSVIVPNYNHARFLRERLASIWRQDFRDYELAVLDDCSTDSSREVIEDLVRQQPFRTVFNRRNSGSPFAQWQRGAELATGRYLWIAESDDSADPRLLGALIRELEAHPQVGLAYCQSRPVSADGQVGESCAGWYRDLDPTRWYHDYRAAGRFELRNHLVVMNTVPNASAVVVRRDVFRRAVAGAETRRLSGDWWTWGRMLLESDVSFVAEPLNYFRMHSNSVRESTKATLACRERFSLQAYLCSESSPSWNVRARCFRASYGPWRHVVRHGPAFPDRRWLTATIRDAQRVYPLALPRMLACLTRARVDRLAGKRAAVDPRSNQQTA